MKPVEPVFEYLLDLLGSPSGEDALPARISDFRLPLLELSRRFKISPWVSWQAIRLWGGELSPDSLQLFQSEYEESKRRSAAILYQVRRLAVLLSEYGIPVVFIKGAAALIRGIFPFGCRYMADIDLLVHSGNAAACRDVLRKAGYREAPGSVAQVHHLQLLIHPSSPAPVEIHTAPYPMLPHELAGADSLWDSAVRMPVLGQPALVPSGTEHAWILLRADPLSRPFLPRLGETLELAYLLGRGEEISFDTLHDRAIRDGMPGIVSGMGYSCRRFFDIPLGPAPETASFSAWESWSRHVLHVRGGTVRFGSARSRFTALLFLPERGLTARGKFLVWMLRYIGKLDRFQPGENTVPSLTVRWYRALKGILGIIVIGIEYSAVSFRDRLSSFIRSQTP